MFSFFADEHVHISDYFFPISLLFFIIGFLVFIRNVATAQKNLEAEHYNHLLQKISDGFFAWTDHPNAIYTCLNLAHNLGLRIPKISTLSQIYEAFLPAETKVLKQLIEQLKRGKEFTVNLSLNNKRILKVNGTFVPVRKKSGIHILVFKDITEEVSTEQKHKEIDHENLFLKTIINRIPIPIWKRDRNLDIIGCNDDYVTMVEAENVSQVVAENREANAQQRQRAQEAKSSGKKQKYKTYFSFQGKRHWMKIVEAPLYDKNHDFIGVLGYALDYTLIDETKKDLKLNIEANETILETLNTPIAVFGADQGLLSFNQAYTELWQFEETWLNQNPSFSEILEAQREKRLLPEFADFPAFKSSETKLFTTLIDSFEDMMYLPNGTTLRRRITPHPLGGLIFTFEDVTDRLALERSYHTRMEVERETINNLHEGIAVFGSDGCMKLQNSFFQELWDLPDYEDEAEPHIQDLMSHFNDLIDNIDDRSNFKGKLIKSVGEHSPENGHIELQNDIFIDYTTIPLPDGNIMVSCIDRTDSIRVERALLERNEALMTADRMKTEFLAHISYELRTPLNTILGFTEVLLNEYFGKINKKQEEYINGILISSKRLATLISDILDLALVEAGQVTLEKKSIDVCNMLQSVLNLTREAARQHNVSIEVDCPNNLNFLIADERRIKQVLFNLVSNAIKFTPSAGNIVLKARENSGKIDLSVIDTGVGIRREDQQRVFEKFETGDSNENVRKPGLGLGLSLVKRVVELHEGDIQIDSALQKGTTITCSIPMNQSM